MNSYNGLAYGTEALVFSKNSGAYPIAQRLVDNYEKLGFTGVNNKSRGVKGDSGKHDLRVSYAPSIILEDNGI